MGKTKRQLRAEAAERLRHLWNACIKDTRQLFGALLDKGAPIYAERNDFDALIDLLSDEPMDAQRDINGTCPDAMRQSSTHSKAHSKTEPNLTEQSELLSDESCRQYADRENLGSNSGTSEDFEVKGSKVDSREKLDADVRNHFWHNDWCRVDMVLAWLDRQNTITRLECAEEYRTRLSELHGLLDKAASERELLRAELTEYKHSHPDAPNQPISQYDAPKSEETAGIHAAKSDIRDFDDSREKLEADVLKWCNVVHLDGFLQDMVIGWLNRQAAITERECIDKRIADQIGNMWESQKIAELQEKVNALTQANDDYRSEWHRVCAERMDLRRELTASKNEGVRLAEELGKTMAERDQWRDKCGAMLDAAQEIRRLADIE